MDVAVDGPLALIGPARPMLRGGMGGVFFRTVGQPGAATVTLKTEQTEPVSLKFIIKTDQTEE